MRQQCANPVRLDRIAFGSRAMDRHILTRKLRGFEDHLATPAARVHRIEPRYDPVFQGTSDNGNGLNAAQLARRVDCRKRNRFSAQSQPIAGILEIAAQHDLAIVKQDRRSDTKTAIGRMGIGGGAPRQCDKACSISHGRTTLHPVGVSTPSTERALFARHITHARSP